MKCPACERLENTMERNLSPSQFHWYHGSEQEFEPGQEIDARVPHGQGTTEKNYFSGWPDWAGGYGSNVYVVRPPENTETWEPAWEAMEADAPLGDDDLDDPYWASDVYHSFGTKEPLRVEKRLSEDEFKEHMRSQEKWTDAHQAFGLDPEDIRKRPYIWEGGGYRPASQPEAAERARGFRDTDEDVQRRLKRWGYTE